jgi:glycosyltransferase involved in cell wall biosynthesis
LSYLDQLRPDVLVTAADPWRVSHLADPEITGFMRERKVVWALYYPIDSDWGRGALPPSLVQLLKAVDLPIVMSQYGHHLSQLNGVTAAYIPPGVDTRVFSRPDHKADAKSALAYENRFVVLSDARNQRRKLWPRTLEIFRRFAADKDDVLLHLHCDPYDPAASSDDYYYDLLSDIAFLGLDKKVRFTRGMSIMRGTSLTQLAALYQAADVHLLASYGEGFGLPTLQAAAAGAVPMAAAYAANRELVKGHGEALRVKGFVRNETKMRCALIDIDEAVGRLDRLYQDRRLLEMKSKASSRFAESYDWEHVLTKWHELLMCEVARRRPSHVGRRSNSREESGHSIRARDTGSRQARSGTRQLRNVSQASTEEMKRRGKSLGDVARDGLSRGSLFTIPVTLAPAIRKLSPVRVTGRVYLATAADKEVFRFLSRIFPGLSAWSTTTFGPGVVGSKRSPFKVVPASAPEFSTFFAASTLAIDLAAADPALPKQAAEFGVPLVGLSEYSDQRWLWPDLSLKTPDVRKAAEKGRWMLTDQYDAMRVCATAKKRFRSTDQKRPGSYLKA